MASTTYAVDKEIISRVHPCLDQVCIEKVEATMSRGGIILVSHKQSDLPTERGVIVAVGPGRYENGVFIKVDLRKGQEVLFQSYPSGCIVKESGKEYTLIAAKQVVAVLE